MNTGNNFLGIVNMQNEIEKDATGDYHSETIAYLESKITELQSVLDRGVSPDEYDSLLGLKAAVEASTRVVGTIWNRNHMQ